MKKNILAIIENLNSIAMLERLTQDQQNSLMKKVALAILKDPSFDFTTKMVITQAQKAGFPQEFLDDSYNHFSDVFLAQDPSEKRTYVDFILRLYANGDVQFGDLAGPDFKETLEKYHILKSKNKVRPPYNDINNFKNYQEFISFVDNLHFIVKKDEEEKEVNVETFYEDDNVKVIIPLNMEASCKYGKGTRWCVSSTTSTNQFEHYNKRGRMHFVIPKDPVYPKEKYVIHFKHGYAWDDDDHTINIKKVIDDPRFSGYLRALEKKSEDYRSWKSSQIKLLESINTSKTRPEKFIPQTEEEVRRRLKWTIIETGRPLTPREINDAVEYIMMTERLTQERYTVAQWYRETIANYSDYFTDFEDFDEIDVPEDDEFLDLD